MGIHLASAYFSARVSVPFAPPEIIQDAPMASAAAYKAVKSLKFLDPMIASFMVVSISHFFRNVNLQIFS